MAVVVIESPRPLVTAADIPGFHAVDDPFITAMIAAAQAAIDGPTGAYGLAIGLQTLEWTSESFGCDMSGQVALPYGPVIELVEVAYRSPAKMWLPIDVSGLEFDRLGVHAPAAGWPSTAIGEAVVRVRYRAGFATREIGGEWVPNPPANARAAVILAAQYLNSLGARNLFLRSDSVDGVGDRTWTVSEAAGLAIERATANLMRPLRVFS